MEETSSKLNDINKMITHINNTIAAIENNTKIEEKSYIEANQIKILKEYTLKDKQKLFALLFKIHELKLNTNILIKDVKRKYNLFIEKYSLLGGTTNIKSEETTNTLLEQKKQNFKNFLSYKKYIELEQQKYNNNPNDS
tara:strand:+ start:1146 stop:1562 length:417 start_codon:yes stop_codon:yes gene_type:complete